MQQKVAIADLALYSYWWSNRLADERMVYQGPKTWFAENRFHWSLFYRNHNRIAINYIWSQQRIKTQTSAKFVIIIREIIANSHSGSCSEETDHHAE